MSLTATAAISPYQSTINSFSSSNDLLTIAMAQQMNNTIIRGYSQGIKKNSAEIKDIQRKLKDVENRKLKLMRMNRNIIQHKATWKQSQLSQQLKNQQKSSNFSNQNNQNMNNNNKQPDLQQNMQNMQNQIQQMQNMMMNMQSHIMANDDTDNDTKSDNDDKEELREWLKDVVKLPQYFQVFIENGIEDLDTVAALDKDTLKQIGIDKVGHQLKILTNAKTIKSN